MDAPARYLIPSSLHRVQETIKRSRFVTTVGHAPDPDAAHAFVDRVRREFPEANHNCWAFVAGPPGSTTHVGMSDDGEPHGTAGRPMLTTLLHSGVGEIVAVCTRWFGGVKLGTGGLTRAYSGGVKLALEELPTEERVERVVLAVTVGYADVDAVHRIIGDLDVVLQAEEYGVDVCCRCAVAEPDLDAFTRAVADVTRGSGTVTREGTSHDL